MSKFRKGESGNPKGRPQGSKHKTTLAAQDLLDGEAQAPFTRKAVELALNGNVVALRLCLERLIPPRKDRPITLKLPKMKGVEGIPKALEAIFKAVAGGEITPAEGQSMAAMLEAYLKGVKLTDIEARLTTLEGQHSE
jgi:hypothetical protein